MPRWSNFLVKDLYDLDLTKFCFSVLYDSLYKKKNDDKRNPTYTNFFEYVIPNTYISLIYLNATDLLTIPLIFIFLPCHEKALDSNYFSHENSKPHCELQVTIC